MQQADYRANVSFRLHEPLCGRQYFFETRRQNETGRWNTRDAIMNIRRTDGNNHDGQEGERVLCAGRHHTSRRRRSDVVLATRPTMAAASSTALRREG